MLRQGKSSALRNPLFINIQELRYLGNPEGLGLVVCNRVMQQVVHDIQRGSTRGGRSGSLHRGVLDLHLLRGGGDGGSELHVARLPGGRGLVNSLRHGDGVSLRVGLRGGRDSAKETGWSRRK